MGGDRVAVIYLAHDEIGRVVAQHDKTELHRPIAAMYKAWKSGADPECPVRSQKVFQQLLAVLAKDGEFHESATERNPEGTRLRSCFPPRRQRVHVPSSFSGLGPATTSRGPGI